MSSSYPDESPNGSNRMESIYAVQGGGVQQESDNIDTVSPPAMVLRSGRKKRKDRDSTSAPPSPASVSSASKSRKKSRASLSVIQEPSESDTAQGTLDTYHLVHQPPISINASIITNTSITAARKVPNEGATGRRLSDIFLPSSDHANDVINSTNPLLEVHRRPPSTPMELAFGGDSASLYVIPDNDRDEGRRDGLSQVLLRQTTQSSLKILSQNVNQPPTDDGPTLFTTHSSILRPLPTRPIPIMSEASAPIMLIPATTLPTNIQIASSSKQMEGPVASSSESGAAVLPAPEAICITTVSDSASSKYHPLQDWKIWAFLFAGAHFLVTSILHQQQYVLPFWKSIPQRSKNQAFWYQRKSVKWGLRNEPGDSNFFNNEQNIEPVEVRNMQKTNTIMNNNVSLEELKPENKQSDVLLSRLLLQDYRKIKSLMQDMISIHGPVLHETNQDTHLPMQVEELDKKIQAQMKLLQDWEEALAQVELIISNMNQVLSSSDSKNRTQIDKNALKTALRRLKNVSPLPIDEDDIFLLDMDHFMENLMENKKCQPSKIGEDDKNSVFLLSRTEFETSKDRMMKYAINTADKLADAIQSNKVMDDIIRSTVDTLKQSMIPYEGSHLKAPTVAVDLHDESSEPKAQKYLTPETLRMIIDERLERNKADLTGKLDYASIRSGAKIIRSGARKSSKSLSENVPLLNRFLAVTKLRFYGHNAEAALTPTIPSDALGQCWSFVKESGSRKIVVLGKENDISLMHHDSTRGAYASLSVRLAIPVKVSDVVIEHPIHIASSATSAIQHFRVFGFEDDNASSLKSWYLGSFKFDICKSH